MDVSSRMFQGGFVLQMKDNVSRTVGVIDADGIVVACSELTCHWGKLARRGWKRMNVAEQRYGLF